MNEIINESINKKKKRIKLPHIRKRWIFLAIMVVLIAVIAVSCINKANQPLSLSFDDTTVLVVKDMQNTVSVTGTVESASSTTVYSILNYPVKEVYVEVGDVVAVGDLLCELDGDNLRDQIESTQASLNTATQSSSAQVKSAEDAYVSEKQSVEQGLNATLISAQSQADAAYENWQTAISTYNRYQDSMDKGENSALLAQEAALNAAEEAYDSAEDAYDEAKDSRSDAKAAKNAKEDELEQAQAEGADPTVIAALQSEYSVLVAAYQAADSLVDVREKAVDFAEDSYEIAKAQYNAACTSADNLLADYSHAVDVAYDNYQTALNSLNAAKAAVDNQLNSGLNTLNTTKAGANTAVTQVNLRQLRADLADTKITAPTEGTVTAVYATVGAAGAGLLFVIEDTENLIIETSVKGYDIGSVKEGMAVTIKSDATGEEVFDGEISRIAPTSNKNSLGESISGSDAVFATDVNVLSQNTGLRIGMSVRLKYIVEERKNVLSVPYDAIYEKENGASYVLIVTEQSSGNYLVSELAVQTGMENDLDVLISGDGVTEGLRVINSPDDYLDYIGKEIVISDSVADAAGTASPFMTGMVE